ncbi:Gluconate 5-dehydrogenase [Maioricimonas rarisocia]|uniref:Gluconate 5-dehydrogenase n=2 Tax=Maioricimonas rarisocia TaxID=2528026 RepID=A0A517Z3R6_9PLAN|nr:Gluconate 5-dehydrogenase [Maioricimonas rarisocia]
MRGWSPALAGLFATFNGMSIMTDQLFSVSDQAVLVSGGSRGIGLSLARGFAERDARVVITGRDERTLAEAAAEISVGAHPVRWQVCDVADADQIPRVVDQVIEELGGIDTLVNVAGVNIRQPVENFTQDQFDFVLDINLRGAFFMAKEVGRTMIARGSGAIINIDSLNSDAPLKYVAPYAMSKCGLNAMTRSLAMEWGPKGVRVNGLAPGFILTDLTQKLWSDPRMEEWGEFNTPMGRLGQPEDLVGTAVFLASPAAAFLTGQTVYVDGGMIAGRIWPIPQDGGQ